MLPKNPTFGQRTGSRSTPIVRRVPVSAAIQPAAENTEQSQQTPPPAAETGGSPAVPAMANTAQGADARWARRTPSRLGAQIIDANLAAPISCTVRDTSSTGARLELQAQRGGNISRDRVPDYFTLFMPADRLEIDCQVMWRQGIMMGVRYTSPARRTAKQQPITRKIEMPKKPHTSLIKILIDPI
jgi:hypothetical protein